MANQVKSKQRVANHGGVLPNEVNAMLTPGNKKQKELIAGFWSLRVEMEISCRNPTRKLEASKKRAIPPKREETATA